MDELRDAPIEALYQVLAEYMVAALPEQQWLVASVYITIEGPEVGEIYGRYVPSDNPEGLESFPVTVESYWLLEEVSRRLTPADGIAWDRGKFTLWPDATFSLDVEYPEVSAVL